jgi:hypothetical protein
MLTDAPLTSGPAAVVARKLHGGGEEVARWRRGSPHNGSDPELLSQCVEVVLRSVEHVSSRLNAVPICFLLLDNEVRFSRTEAPRPRTP